MKSIFTALAALIWMVFSGTSVDAQPHDWRGGMERATRVTAEFGLEYEVSNERLLPLHFSVEVPFVVDHVQTQTRAMSEGNVFEARFVTPDGVFLEYVTISTGTAGDGDMDAKLQNVFEIIEGQIYPTLGLTGEVDVLGGRAVQIGGRPAVEWMAMANLPDQGPLVARIVGVIAPDDMQVAFVVQQTMRDRMGLGGPDDMGQTYGGTIAGSVRFQAYRDAAGNLVSF